MTKILTARYVVPISTGPIIDGAVAIDGDRMIAIGSRQEVEALHPSAEGEEFGNAAIIPGLVNCHSHLELTAFRGALDDVENDFRAWLLRLNSLRAGMSDDDVMASAIAGAREGAAAGVTCFGDIGRLGHAGVAALKEVGLRGIVYQETEFSPDNRTAEDDFKKLAEKVEQAKDAETELIRIGISPHSPYTVSSKLFELIAQHSIIERIPLTIHAAESRQEHDLLTKGDGFFTEIYDKFDLEWLSPMCTSIEYLERLGVLAARPVLAHCVFVSDSDIPRIAGNGATVAHCPKSNAKFGHGFAPFEKMLEAGIAVGLGSDSVASNNLCDLLEESRFAALTARNRPGRSRFISARDALEAATLGGARALGLDHLIGSLEVGKQADITVVSLDHKAQQPINDIYAALVFSSSGRDVVKTQVAGRIVYADPDPW